MKEAIETGNIEDILDCLLECFNKFKKYVFWGSASDKGREEDTFWCAAFKLINKRKRGHITLTTSVCNYFQGFVRKCQRKTANVNITKPLDDLYFLKSDSPFDDLADSLGEHLDAIEKCLETLDQKCQTIIRSDLFGVYGEITDDELAALIEYGNWRGVSVKAKRCYDEIWVCIDKNYPGLFPEKIKRP